MMQSNSCKDPLYKEKQQKTKYQELKVSDKHINYKLVSWVKTTECLPLNSTVCQQTEVEFGSVMVSHSNTPTRIGVRLGRLDVITEKPSHTQTTKI